MANYCRAFRGLEKEVFIKIYFTLLTRLCPCHSKNTKGRKILLYHTHIPLNNLILITSQKKMFFLVQDRKSFFNCFFRIAEENKSYDLRYPMMNETYAYFKYKRWSWIQGAFIAQNGEIELLLASYADVLRLVTRSSPRTSAQRTGHFRSLAVSLCFKRTNLLFC